MHRRAPSLKQQKMHAADLKKLCQARGVKTAGLYEKGELIDAILDQEGLKGEEHVH
jgi:hypothetical protein